MERVFRWKERERLRQYILVSAMQVLLGAKSWSRWPGQLIGSAVGFCREFFSGGCMLSQYQAAAWLSANQCNRPLMILLLGFVRLPKVTQKARIKNWETCAWSESLLVSIYYSSYRIKFRVFLSCSRAGLQANQSVHWSMSGASRASTRVATWRSEFAKRKSSGDLGLWETNDLRFQPLGVLRASREILRNLGVQTALEIQSITWILDTSGY